MSIFYLSKEMGVLRSDTELVSLLKMILQDNRKLFSPENGSWSACRFHLFKKRKESVTCSGASSNIGHGLMTMSASRNSSLSNPVLQ